MHHKSENDNQDRVCPPDGSKKICPFVTCIAYFLVRNHADQSAPALKLA